MDVATLRLDLLFELFEVEVQVRQGVLFDGARVTAQGVELRQLRDGQEPLVNKTTLGPAHRLLQIRIVERDISARGECVRGGLHDSEPWSLFLSWPRPPMSVMPAITSTA